MSRYCQLTISRGPGPKEWQWTVTLPDGHVAYRSGQSFKTLDACADSAQITGVTFLAIADRDCHPRRRPLPSNPATRPDLCTLDCDACTRPVCTGSRSLHNTIRERL